MLPDDIITKVRHDSSEEHAITILQLLKDYHQQHPDNSARILRCIVFLAQGSFEKFAESVSLAQLDWRDLIVSAEYDGWSGEECRIRNFNEPFVT